MTQKTYKYPVAKPDLSGREKEYIDEVMKSGWISSSGEFVKKFEKLFSQKHKAKFGVACSSGTNALVLALKSLGIGEGDEVIVPEFTMIATAWAVSMTGATPVFTDVDMNMLMDVRKETAWDISLLERAITSKTKAIIPVHIYGRKCNMKEILKIAHDYNLYVVEDSSEAHGVPLTGDIACFSLYANKIITSGEGGICITNNERLAEQMRHLRGMAFSENHNFWHKKFAYNFRMTNLQAAIALAQTERLEKILEKRKKIEQWYDKYLPNNVKSGMKKRDVLWMYDITTKVGERDNLMKFLANEGIETRMFFKPMSLQPMYFNPNVFSTRAFYWSLLGLYLPTYNQLKEEDVKFIANKVKEFYANRNTWKSQR